MQLRAFIPAYTGFRRQAVALSGAAGFHLLLVAAFLTLPPSAFELPRTHARIVLFTEAAPETADAEAPPATIPEAAPVPAATPDPVAAVEPQTTPAPLPPVSARSGEPDAAPADDAAAYPLSPGTRSVLVGLQCPGHPEHFARTGLCPQAAGRASSMTAAGEAAQDFYAIDVASIRALFGLSLHALAGQSTLDDGTARRGLSNADSIRDALPASQPDPAFGD